MNSYLFYVACSAKDSTLAQSEYGTSLNHHIAGRLHVCILIEERIAIVCAHRILGDSIETQTLANDKYRRLH